ncbi:MAG: hypothetical protein A2741_02340 [Candidatus Zambryskibacteria bacterium RIFCSPHIGHO2_01_FULL_43_27]|uniref:Elongation factor P C-terminal domain-containing protein n=1 Tax=Candidatus Zambryskibacteria bacterium RIFCSPLOWO2_01_FULL_43_17 TaxID=1802760 RepID=A0A1G2U6H3_9BACT|nr:MAG: hypothetical protein A2741_02340 [Candidatus Zambryskibacteria bacterium RIFCSPHIGHO2_01_FULL_43_27]OHB00515.1 MAG: hypothetical protein A3E93_01820 [Candidatus Zambryskibacteria bacterium RIFCSPHIGHO2_12_FULL_43_12b]OHB04532.1 MAG: hypothetical protein A2920_01130 [Candidatus Zambryskibacteria bacterium RIFCSPLOWO2_01_FULL_43_17]
MLEYNEITEHKVIILDGAPYEVLNSHVFRKQQRKPVNATKLKNLITGKVTERSFHVSEKAEEAEMEEKEVKFLYTNKGEWWFCEINDPSKRFSLPAELIGERGGYLKPNTLVGVIIFEEKIIGVKLPIKVDLKVTEAHPAVKGDTAKGGSKQVVLETGATLQVPMFVKEGDIVRINTETGEYTDRIGNSF